MNPRNRASIVIARPPAEVFAFITDVDQLPAWNDLITGVVSKPADLQPGSVWKVSLAQGPMRWVSRSTVVEHDPTLGRFIYRSGTDDDNPSYAMWSWQVTPHPLGSELTVSWSVNPRTRIRRWVLAPLRARRLRAEVPTSLERLRTALDATDLAHTP
jgi:uncharacterized protein YndB with AHSA1/START domain